MHNSNIGVHYPSGGTPGWFVVLILWSLDRRHTLARARGVVLAISDSSSFPAKVGLGVT